MENGVDTFVEVHEHEIREHLNHTTKERATKGDKRVKELTESKHKYARLASTESFRVE
jgi:hypothetical protein